MSIHKFSSKNKAVDAARKRIQTNRAEDFNASDIADAIIDRNREELAKAITLIESENPSDRPLAQELLKAVKHLSPHQETLRIGITGIPGVGKSTFIERLGLDATCRGCDPSDGLNGKLVAPACEYPKAGDDVKRGIA